MTVFRDDLGEGTSFEALEAMSGKKRNSKLDAIKTACQAYIAGPLLTQLEGIVRESLDRVGIVDGKVRIEPDQMITTSKACCFGIRI